MERHECGVGGGWAAGVALRSQERPRGGRRRLPPGQRGGAGRGGTQRALPSLRPGSLVPVLLRGRADWTLWQVRAQSSESPGPGGEASAGADGGCTGARGSPAAAGGDAGGEGPGGLRAGQVPCLVQTGTGDASKVRRVPRINQPLQEEPVQHREMQGQAVMQAMQPPSEADSPRDPPAGAGAELPGPEPWRQRFRGLCYRDAPGPREVCRRLQELCRGWLEPQRRSKEQVLELVVLEQFLAILPPGMRSWEWGRSVQTCAQAVALAEGFQRGLEEDEKRQVAARGKVQDVGAEEMPPLGARREPGDAWREQPQARGADRPLEKAGHRETPGPQDPEEEPPPRQESDCPKTEETWEMSADESSSGCCPRRGPSPGAGAGTLSRAEQKRPGEEPVTLELHRAPPGSLEERGSPTRELGQLQKGQGRPPRQELREVFEDVAVYFTQKEWELLEDEDKVLYRDQMLKNFDAFISLGYQGPTPDLICSIQKGQVELWVGDDEDGGEISGPKDLLSGGAWLLSRAEEQPPADGAADLEPAGTSPGSLAEMDPLTPEEDQWHKSQGRPQKQKGNEAVNQHRRTHLGRKTHRCTECKKNFICWQDLSQHQCGQHCCTKCGKRFKQLSNLARHWCMHTRDQPHQCSECGKSFTRSSHLAQHKRIHMGEKPHQCLECGKCFPRSSDLTKHWLIHTGEKPHQCSECGKSFSRPSHLARHQRIHTGDKPHRCSECGKSFSRPSHLARHQLIHTGGKPHQCSECGKSFTQSLSLAQHQQIHRREKRHWCSECGKSFPRSSDLTKHQLIHTGEKPHQCSECGKSFNRSSNLARHQLIHTGEKRHQCSECGKTFTRYSYLAQHLLTHTGEKRHQCSECGKSFTRSSHLAQHQRIHTGEKPHQCSECGKSFTQSSNLARHQLIHIGEKTNQCSHCGKSFACFSSLAQHQLIHLQEKPHQCSDCWKSFTRSSNLTKHQLIHTGVKPH
ncbi:zinc finger protein 708 [Alligator mississippiensis]|uniref:zinc finger protein 708 n=1 Tax=Alligator mississippiensis TaxID=8496 RepID=UPI002877640E|nr:zinc finger protein 708 [Alligator mississippiensis]